MDQKKPDQQSATRRASTPYLRRIVTEFCRTALDDYDQAGCPFGDRVDGMLIWFEFGQGTTVN